MDNHRLHPSRWIGLFAVVSRGLVALLVGVVRFYQRAISSRLQPRCRFMPTCSSYAIQSLQKYGVVRGLAKTTWRVCRCHPLGKAGYDPP